MTKRIYPLDQYEKYFATFSAHAIEYKNVLYPTVEHAYHCQRYTNAEIKEEIRATRSAYLSWKISQKYKSKQMPGFDEYKAVLMEELCRTKLAQHADVKEALMDSGEDVIVKNYPDPFWGIGMDARGKNMMGIIWQKLRGELKD